jgi:hypothetical protein
VKFLLNVPLLWYYGAGAAFVILYIVRGNEQSFSTLVGMQFLIYSVVSAIPFHESFNNNILFWHPLADLPLLLFQESTCYCGAV